MKKSDLIKIINKYNVGGRCNSVRWKVESKTLFIRCKDSYFCEVTANNFDFDDNEIGVIDSDSLVKLMSALDEDFTLKVGYDRNKATTLVLEDSGIDVKYMLGDLTVDVLKEVPPLKGNPPTNISFDLAKETMDRFVKGKSALKVCKIFAVIPDEGQVDIVLNYSDKNTNRIKMTIGAEINDELDPMFFDAEVVSDIFSANKDCQTAKFELAKAGLLTLTFNGENWNTKYCIHHFANL